MQAVKANRTINQPQANHFLYFSIILVIFAVVGIYAFNAIRAYQASLLPQGTVVITQKNLEEKYGLRVNLVAVTAAGGMVDLRLKILDGEKAKSLLQNKKNFPSLFIGGQSLNVSDDTKTQTIDFTNQANFYLLFPNDRGLVKSGTSVTIIFGDTAVEPIPAK